VTIPNLYRVISEPGNDLVIVVLETVDALGILGPAIDSLQVVVAAAPVVLDRVDVLQNVRH
jgi:hypothetical protein